MNWIGNSNPWILGLSGLWSASTFHKKRLPSTIALFELSLGCVIFFLFRWWRVAILGHFSRHHLSVPHCAKSHIYMLNPSLFNCHLCKSNGYSRRVAYNFLMKKFVEFRSVKIHGAALCWRRSFSREFVCFTRFWEGLGCGLFRTRVWR